MSDFDAALERLVGDPAFREALAGDPDRALAGYRLSPDELAVLRSQVDTGAGTGERHVEQRTSKASLFGLASPLAGGGGIGAGMAGSAAGGQPPIGAAVAGSAAGGQPPIAVGGSEPVAPGYGRPPVSAMGGGFASMGAAAAGYAGPPDSAGYAGPDDAYRSAGPDGSPDGSPDDGYRSDGYRPRHGSPGDGAAGAAVADHVGPAVADHVGPAGAAAGAADAAPRGTVYASAAAAGRAWGTSPLASAYNDALHGAPSVAAPTPEPEPPAGSPFEPPFGPSARSPVEPSLGSPVEPPAGSPVEAQSGRAALRPAEPPAGYHTRVDADGDGRWDRFTAVDRGSDGIDLVVDRDNDGRAEFVGHDLDRDGLIDEASTDSDRDGRLDTRWVDGDGDGWLDRRVPVREPLPVDPTRPAVRPRRSDH